MAMYSPEKSMSEDLKGIIETYNCEYSIRSVHKTNIQGYVMAMYSPDKSMSEDLKGIIET